MPARRAGILMHISSLPSVFGIGDLGPAAYEFADFLERSNQKIWQILPLNPVDGGQGFSPYSSISSSAANSLFISPEILARENFLEQNELEIFRKENHGHVNFDEVSQSRLELFNLVWEKEKATNKITGSDDFKIFCSVEKNWLDDFALFSIIKEIQQGKPWWEWPVDLKNRNQQAMQSLVSEYWEPIKKIKFLQYIFQVQWQALKTYCNGKGIQILGDISFYVSYDSSDAWSNREIFRINNDGELVAVAGTPPDMFSEDGQLWNMPVFNWRILKSRNYDWWIQRIKRNKELFDLVRLDHFRGFAAFWEVPAPASTAKNGRWKKGPGADFFRSIEDQLGRVEFVAEDLGHIDEEVISLRERFRFPGMKVLQFAFDENMANSVHIPHQYERNFFAFTGTHDNNTTRGWWTNDIDDAMRQRIMNYCDRDLNDHTVTDEMIRLIYFSVADNCVIPMQDVLNLDATARMNTPSSPENNWSWRLRTEDINQATEEKLKTLTILYGRC